MTTVTPYVFFNGKCEEALDFYKKALGAEVLMMMRYSETPEKPDPNMVPPGHEHKICHATIKIGATEVMASDGCPTQETKFDGFSFALGAKDEAEAQRFFAALSEGGQVRMPLAKTFFSPAFGMVADKFGMNWMVNVPQPMPR